MFRPDPSEWGPWDFWLYGFALYCAGAFVWYWFRFPALERRAKADGPDAVRRYNKALSGFPNTVYAKMLGKKKYQQ